MKTSSSKPTIDAPQHSASPVEDGAVLRAQDQAATAGRSRRSLVRTYGPVVGVVVVLIVLAAVFVPSFLGTQNLLNVLQQMSIIGVVSIGMTCVILTGGIDLSVGAVLELTTVVFASALKAGVPVPIAILLALVIGGVAGLLNGIGSTVFRIQPFVMTLATLAIAEGIALAFTNGSTVYFASSSPVVAFLGGGGIGPVSGEFVVFGVLVIVAWLVLRFVPFGRYIYAVGGSAETARLSGIRVKTVLCSTFVISGVCAAIGGIMTASRLGVGVPTAGGLTNLDAIAAVVIGGTSLMGGRGSIWGTVGGALVLAVISNVITLVGISPYQSEIIRGCVIVAAVLIGSVGVLRNRQRTRQTA
jgi:ribose transport system permease protein